MKKLTILKIFLTIILFGILFIKVNFFDIVKIIFSLNIVYLIGAFILVPVLYIIRTERWNQFLHFFGINLQFFESFKILIIGTFYGLITPGKIGELGRVFHIREKKVLTLPTIIMEKLVDISTLVGLSLLTIIVCFPKDSIMLFIIIFFIAAVVLGVFLLTNEKIIFLIMIFFGIGRTDCDQFTQNFRKLLYNFPLIRKSFLLSLVYYGICYLIGYFIILSAGFNPITFITLPIIILMGNIPLTIAGLGLRESVGSIAFVYLGESAADGFVFAFLLFIIITLIPGIFGYIFTMQEE
jgi:glycosyltransferase 2 family protein